MENRRAFSHIVHHIYSSLTVEACIFKAITSLSCLVVLFYNHAGAEKWEVGKLVQFGVLFELFLLIQLAIFGLYIVSLALTIQQLQNSLFDR